MCSTSSMNLVALIPLCTCRDVVEQGLPVLLDPSWEVPADAYLADKLQARFRV